MVRIVNARPGIDASRAVMQACRPDAVLVATPEYNGETAAALSTKTVYNQPSVVFWTTMLT